MRLHYLQHVPFEDAANIAAWAAERGHTMACTRLDLDEPLPAQNSLDWLVIMGGPMNIYEHEAYPWLAREKEFIRRAIDRGAGVLGVCLGAQLVADVLGGSVTRNPQKEIGWFPVTLTDAGLQSPLLPGFSRRFTAFHWHGDTFSIPPGATRLAETSVCRNQAFQYGEHVLGLQFHLDCSAASIQQMIHHCGAELVPGRTIQKPEQMLPAPVRLSRIRTILYALLDAMEHQLHGRSQAPPAT